MSWEFVWPWGADEWSAFGSNTGALATGLATAAVIYAARTAFPQWRKQKQHERQMVVAEEILAVAYKAKRAFPAIRDPISVSTELSAAKQDLLDQGIITDATSQADVSTYTTAQNVFRRARQHDAAFDALLEKMPVAKAIFGDDVANAMDDLWRARGKIMGAAQTWATFRTRPQPPNAELAARLDQKAIDLEGTFWAHATEGDPFMTQVNDAVDMLESQLLPIIRDQPVASLPKPKRRRLPWKKSK